MARYSKPDPTKADLKLLWQKTILDQITRIMQAFSEGDAKTRFERIYMSVMGLDNILKYYQDKKFRKDMQVSEESVKDVLAEIESIKKEVTQEDMQNIDFMRSKNRLDKLMDLIGRSGFYPDQDVGGSEAKGVLEEEDEQET
jgi:hypothetical protein